MNKKLKKELLFKIHTQTNEISSSDLKAIKQSKYLKTELEIAIKMNQKIENIPKDKFNVPSGLRSLVMKRILEPVYKIWHILLVMFFIIVSPLFLYWETEIVSSLLEEHLLITIFIYYGILITLLFLPLSFHIITKHKTQMEDLKIHCDEYLDHGIDKAKNLLSKK